MRGTRASDLHSCSYATGAEPWNDPSVVVTIVRNPDVRFEFQQLPANVVTVWRWSTMQDPNKPPGVRCRHPFADRVGEPVRVIAKGNLNSLLIEFEDGTRAVCSRHAIGDAKPLATETLF